MAKKYHPDTNQDDPQAKEKFAKLAEAYEVGIQLVPGLILQIQVLHVFDWPRITFPVYHNALPSQA